MKTTEDSHGCSHTLSTDAEYWYELSPPQFVGDLKTYPNS